MADNKSVIYDENGAFSDWIEITNNSRKEVNLSGFFLSDNKEQLKKHRIKDVVISKKSQYIFWASGNKHFKNHLNFKLNKKKGVIILTTPDGKTVISEIKYNQQIIDYSMIKIDDDWFYSDNPTPGAINNIGNLLLLSDTLDIEFEKKDSIVQVTIRQKKNGIIKYTIDGTSPLKESAKTYNGVFNLEIPCIVNAAQFGDNIITINEFSFVFIDTSKHKIPIVSLITDSENLWDAETGIYVLGNNRNYYQRSDSWIKNGKIEYYKHGKDVFEKKVRFKIFGSGTRNKAKKSLTIMAKSKKMKNVFFESVDEKNIDGFVLRAAYFDRSRYKNDIVKNVNDIMGANV